MAETMGKTTTKKTATRTTAAPSAKPVEKKAVAVSKPVAAKAAEKKPAATKTAAKKPAAKRAAKTMDVTAEQRYRMVAEAAYYRAESNQFQSDPVRDWIEAESDIAMLLDGRK